MRMLFLSCHAVHEVDEVSIFTELGLDVFTKGAYQNNSRPVVKFGTDGQSKFLNEEDINVLKAVSANNLTKKIVEKFDIIYIASRLDWVVDNWEEIKHKIVLLRLIGQSDDHSATVIKPYVDQGLKLIGYSPHENRRFDGLIHKTIRFYKDESEFCNWCGSCQSILTVNQFIERGEEIYQTCRPKLYKEVTDGFNRVLVGSQNDYKWSIGFVGYTELKNLYKQHRVYFHVGTNPGSYTFNFIEAWMTGIPVVSLDVGEIGSLITNQVNGYVSNDVNELKIYINLLLNDYTLAQKIGEGGRLAALKYFAKGDIKQQWSRLFRETFNEHFS